MWNGVRSVIGPVFNAEGKGGGSAPANENSKIKTVVMPVAGLATRMGHLTNSTPKHLLPITSDKTLIDIAVAEALNAGAETIVLVCNPGDDVKFREHFSPSRKWESATQKDKSDLLDDLQIQSDIGAKIKYVFQNEPKGLGHAVLQARDYVEGPFGVILPDDVILDDQLEPVGLSSMAQHYQGGQSVARLQVPIHEASRYGVFIPEEGSDVSGNQPILIKGMVEKPKDPPSNMAVMGRYILEDDIFDVLENLGAGAGGEIQLTDAIALEMERGVPSYAAHYDGVRYDCGTRKGYRAALTTVLHREESLERVAAAELSKQATPATSPK